MNYPWHLTKGLSAQAHLLYRVLGDLAASTGTGETPGIHDEEMARLMSALLNKDAGVRTFYRWRAELMERNLLIGRKVATGTRAYRVHQDPCATTALVDTLALVRAESK